MKRLSGLISVLIWGLMLSSSGVTFAQSNIPDQVHPRQVFLTRNVDGTGLNRLIFLDLLTGDSRAVDQYGERYTVTPQGVLFFSPSDNRVKLVSTDGVVRDHPFIQPRTNTRRIDWLVDADAQAIVWTLTEGAPGLLTTITSIASFDGSGMRELLVDGPREGIRAFPVAFSVDRTAIYMDYQPDTIADYTTFRQYAGLFSLDAETGTEQPLPGEPGCFCGAGIGSGWFLRLSLTPDLTGFDLLVRQLDRNLYETIPSLDLPSFTQGGDILVNPDGTLAVYALAQVRNFGTPDQEVETVLVLVDLNTLTQTVLGSSFSFLLHPTAWTEDSSAVILTSRQEEGTWKVSIPSGQLEQVAQATYLGTIRASA